MAISLYGEPKARASQTKFFKVSRTETTAAIKAVLPKDAVISGVYVIGGAVSNAATTATLSVGTTSTATDIVNAFDVKTNGKGYHPVGSVGGATIGVKFDADYPIFAKYAETGTASTSGGPWIVKLEYFIPGPGEEL